MATSKKEGQGSERRQRKKLLAIRVSGDEYAELNARADAAGLSVAAFIRHQALGTPGPRSVRRLPLDGVLIRQLIGQLNYIGNNLNQLTRLAHIGDLEEPRELSPVLMKIDSVADACFLAVGRDP